MSAHGCGHTLASLTTSLCAGLASLRFGLRLAVRVGSCSASDLRLDRDHRTLRPARGAKAVNKGTVRRPRDLALSARQTLLCIGLVAGCVRRFSLGFANSALEHVPRTFTSAHGLKTPSGSLATCRSEEHTSELQSRENLVCRLLPETKNSSHC